MSLINNVLRGLDSKPPTFTPLQMDQLQTPVSSKPSNRGIFTLLSVVALVCSVYLMYLFLDRFETVETPREALDLTVTAVPDEVSKPPDQPLNNGLAEVEQTAEKMNGLQINENTDYLELSLLLTQGTQSILTYSGKNRYIFLISQAGQNLVIPDMPENQWLRRIGLKPTEAGLELEFITASGVLVETQHRLKAADNYWVIQFKKAQQDKRVPGPTVTLKSQKSAKPEVADKPVTTALEVKADEPRSVSVQPVKLEIKPVKSGLSDGDRLNQARIYMQEKNWQSAEQLLKQLQGGELDISARINLLSLYRYQQKYMPMTQMLNASLERYPDELEFKLIDARNHFERQDFAGLIARYQDESLSRDILNLVATSAQRINSHEQAVTYFKRSLTLDPQQPKSWISLAISQEQSGLFGHALQSYQMAQRSGPLTPKLQDFAASRIQQLANTGR